MTEPDPVARLKDEAGRHAAMLVESGQIVGLGSGSTAARAIRWIGERIARGELSGVTGVATSEASAALARQLGIPLADDAGGWRPIDIGIDGADEVDPAGDLIKGGGGALLPEKIVAQASRRFVVVLDESKLSPALGTRRPVPVEVVTFGWRAQVEYLESLGARVRMRTAAGGEPFRTPLGHLILDCAFGPIADPRSLAAQLAARAGIVEHGLFLGLATELVVASSGGVERRRRGEPLSSPRGFPAG